MEKKIDWSKAPEGATHYSFGGNGWKAAWYIVDGKFISVILDDGKDCEWERRAIDKQDSERLLPRLIERPAAPAAWNGEGLPPVDLICTFVGTNACRSNIEELRHGAIVTIIAHYEQTNGEPLAAFTFIDEDGEKRIGGAMASCFEPIKTADQVEAETKAKEMAEMLTVFEAAIPPAWDTMAGIEALHKAGYRKQ